jgi:hypothetical protein
VWYVRRRRRVNKTHNANSDETALVLIGDPVESLGGQESSPMRLIESAQSEQATPDDGPKLIEGLTCKSKGKGPANQQ